MVSKLQIFPFASLNTKLMFFGYLMQFCTLHVQSVLSLVHRWPWLQDEVHWLLEGESQIIFDHVWWTRPFQQVPLLGKEIICLCILGFISQIFWLVKRIHFLLIALHIIVFIIYSPSFMTSIHKIRKWLFNVMSKLLYPFLTNKCGVRTYEWILNICWLWTEYMSEY